MTFSQDCVRLNRQSEGCSLNSYWDDKGKVWTIGWGSIGVNCQFSGDTGAHYAEQEIQGTVTTIQTSQTTAASSVACAILGANGATASNEITIPFYSASASYHTWYNTIAQLNGTSLGTGTNLWNNTLAFWWNPSSPTAVTSILLTGSSNIGSGTMISVYGIN